MGVYFDSSVMALPHRLAAVKPMPEIVASFPDSELRYAVTMLAENDKARTWLDRMLLKYLSRRGYAVTGCWHLMGFCRTQSRADAACEFILSQQPKALVKNFPLPEDEILPLEKLSPRSLTPSGKASQYKVVSIADLEKLKHAMQ